MIPADAPDWAQRFAREIQDFMRRQRPLSEHNVNSLPSAKQRGLQILVKGSTPDPVLAYSDGSNWRKSTDGSTL